jgi:signal transduction histidine kinase
MVATMNQLEAGFWDLLEAFQSVSVALARSKDLDAVAEAAVRLALDLTRARVAFVTLSEDVEARRHLFFRTSDSAPEMTVKEIGRLVAAASARGPEPDGLSAAQAASGGPGAAALRSHLVHELTAGGRLLGTIGVAGVGGHTWTEQRAFAVFSSQVASAIEVAQLLSGPKQMADALDNMRAELDRSEHARLVTEERAQAADRVEKAHEAAIAALVAVSVHAGSGGDAGDFYRRLTSSIAELVGANKVLFWQLNENGTLTAIPGGHGVDEAFVSRLYPAECSPEKDDLTSRVVFQDHTFRASRGDRAREHSHVLEVLGVADAVSVAWRAGELRLGLVAAYDSVGPGGFSREDAWVLQKAGLAAGLVWQLKYAQADLERTVERLKKVDAARQLLLKNVSTAVDKARRRFASELHDDALQKLTAAELMLHRVGEASAADPALLAETRQQLAQTEEALRHLLFEVRPPALELPGGFEETIGDRIALLQSAMGIRAEVDMELPDDLPFELKGMVFRQVAEALANVERHSSATEVRISIKVEDGAVHGVVIDNGRGFVVAERSHLPGHLGLLALNERSLLSGGWTKVESEPGLGTTVEFWMPSR